MEVFLNDLSLAGQYPDPLAFRAALEPLLALRAKRADLQGLLYCSRLFSDRPATVSLSVQEAVRATRDKIYIRLVLGWIAKAGPFWEDDRFFEADDYFHFDNNDVTDQGLGEAARRTIGGLEAGSFSFLDGSGRFDKTPLNVIHGLEEAPVGNVEVRNLWTTLHLETVVDSKPKSWNQMLQQAQGRFSGLVMASQVGDALRGQPFHNGIADRVLILLQFLQNLVDETKDDQSLTAKGLGLWQEYSVGHRAYFTDESESNERTYRSELTFRDFQTGSDVFCPWHGKIKLNQFRIHFEWPRPRGQKKIKIFYIGPKITKK